MRRISVLVIWSALLAAAPVSGQEIPKVDFGKIIEESRIGPLGGKPSPYFRVFVEMEVQSQINQETLQTATELILRRNGIPLLEKVPSSPPWAFLSLHVEAIKSAVSSTYALRISLEFSEEASVKRRGESASTVVVPTWRDSILMIVGEAKLQSVREDARVMIERFCLDYLKANPVTAQ